MRKEFKPVRIAVIGTLCRDRIIRPDKSVTNSFGGIAYTILTLASLLESKAEIIPICNVGLDRFSDAVDLFKQSPDVKLNGLSRVEEKNNAVTLIYKDSQNREEILAGGVPSLRWEQVEPFLDADYILINFISGWDIELEALQKVRKKSKAKIYLDLHSLTLGMDEKGRRFSKKPKDCEKYVACADYLQLNQTELETILGKKIKKADLAETSGQLVELGPEMVMVTLSDRGCHLTYRSVDNENVYKELVSKPVSPVVDTTGCGDVFGAGFLAKLIVTKDPVQAADFANYVAGLKATFSGLEGLRYFTPLDLEFA